MRVLLFLVFVLAFNCFTHRQLPHLVIFNSDGTYYKLLTQSKQVDWHKSLGSNLLSFQIGSGKSDALPSSYIVPTLDGHFLYIDAQSQILVHIFQRRLIENRCNNCSTSRQKVQQQSIQYFIYQRFEYYIINLNNGVAQDIQTFLNNGIPADMDSMVMLKISKKYLKQLKKNLTVAWSTISSELNLIPAKMFLSNPKDTSFINSNINQSSKLKFRRIGSNQIEMLQGQNSFEMGGKSHILSIFQFLSIEKGYFKHPLPYYNPPKLALEYIPHQNENTIKDIIQSGRLQNSQNVGFLHSQQINKKKKDIKSHLQICINTFRTLQAITYEANKGQITSNFQLHFPKIDNLSNYSLIFPRLQNLNEPIIKTYGPTQDQPFIWMALILMICFCAYVLYKMKINSLLTQISAMESKTGRKLQQFQQKLGQMQQLKKMYQVYWDKIVYQVAGQQWYQHVVFQGKFLNQSAYTYAIRLQGTDTITLQHKLNTLLNFSHKGLAKLYYYTRNSQFLLIFTEKISPLSSKSLPDYLNVPISSNMKKQAITQLIQAVSYLDGKIQVNSLPTQAIHIQPKIAPQGSQSFYQIKLNAVPCLLRKPFDQSDQQESKSWSADNSSYQLRENITSVCHLLIHEGKSFCKKTVDQKLKNQAYSQEEYLQFFDFVLYEVRGKGSITQKDIQGGTNQNLREAMFKDILDHPYLWDSKRKILFLSDFSNYIQTHIDQSKVRKLQSHAKEYKVIKIPWIKQFHFMFVKQINNYRKYDYESVRDLIRVIRNKLNHFHEIPKDVRNHIGKTPEGFIEYCLELFPKLLHFAFVYTRKKKWKLHMK